MKKKCREYSRWIKHDYDFSYLLMLERHKFKRMAKYFNKSRLVECWEDQVRTCNLCVKLIDIILEEDAYYKNWLHNSFGKGKSIIPFPIHINTKNYKRFYYMDYVLEPNKKLYWVYCADLRIQKALYLYHKIRNYKLFKLWD